jgi:hypothetical protein
VLLPFGPLAIVLHYLSGTHVRTPATHFVSKSSQSFSFSSFFFANQVHVHSLLSRGRV